MNKLYCDDCGNYLMGGDGECHDCPCGWKQPEKYSMSVDWHNNVVRASSQTWIVTVYRAETSTGREVVLAQMGAPSEELAHKWAEDTIAYWRGDLDKKEGANTTEFLPDVYIVPQEVYSYTIKQE